MPERVETRVALGGIASFPAIGMGDWREMSRPDPEVEGFLEGITNQTRRRDAETMIELMGRVTGEKPQMWGSIVGFGRYHYRYESGREGDAPAVAFSPRKPTPRSICPTE